jgi:hypothetical protein
MTYLECSCGRILHSKTISQTWKDHQAMNAGHYEIRRFSFPPREEVLA